MPMLTRSSIRFHLCVDHALLHYRTQRPLDSNSSTGLPEGSLTRICFPPGPETISLRNRAPDCLSFSTNDTRSSVSSTSLFQPPGSGLEPSASGREAELPGPLSQSVRSPRLTIANGGPHFSTSAKPRVRV